MLRGVLFDLDQTLFDRRAAFRAMVAEGLARRGLRAPQRAVAWTEIDDVDASGYGRRSALLPVLARHLDWSGDDLEVTFRTELLRHVRLDDGVRELLCRLRRRFRLGLLSDGSRAMQAAKLERLGLSDVFDRVQFSGDSGLEKPDPRAFLAFAEAWKDSPRALCMVGDHALRDVRGALEAGLRAVQVGGDAHAADPRAAWIPRVTELDAPGGPLCPVPAAPIPR